MPALAEFQSEFARALLNPNATLRNRVGVGLAVYQNTVMKGLVDVLRANYPTVERLVGAEWFESIAILFARQHVPEQPVLALYGAAFPEFLDEPGKMHGLHYLSFVAQLDRLWTEAHFAADAAVLQAADLQGVELQTTNLQWHAATRVAWVPHSAVSIWRHNRPPSPSIETLAVDDVEQGMLLTRPHGAIVATQIDRIDYDFLQYLRSGMSLGETAIAVLQRYPEADVATVLARLLQAGAFASLEKI